MFCDKLVEVYQIGVIAAAIRGSKFLSYCQFFDLNLAEITGECRLVGIGDGEHIPIGYGNVKSAETFFQGNGTRPLEIALPFLKEKLRPEMRCVIRDLIVRRHIEFFEQYP